MHLYLYQPYIKVAYQYRSVPVMTDAVEVNLSVLTDKGEKFKDERIKYYAEEKQ